jgi:hypothetical protein
MSEAKADYITPIRFQAQIIKIQTTTEGAIRLTLDMAETAIDTAGKLMQVRAKGGLLELAALPIDPVSLPVLQEKSENVIPMEKRTKRKSKRTPPG